MKYSDVEFCASCSSIVPFIIAFKSHTWMGICSFVCSSQGHISSHVNCDSSVEASGAQAIDTS